MILIESFVRKTIGSTWAASEKRHTVKPLYTDILYTDKFRLHESVLLDCTVIKKASDYTDKLVIPIKMAVAVKQVNMGNNFISL